MIISVVILTGVLVMHVMYSSSCNVSGNSNSKEKFQNFVVNDIKSVLYNTNGFVNFYSSGDNASIYFKEKENFNDFVSYVMFFLPSFMDDYCKSFDKQETDSTRCNNLFIDNVSSPDVMFPSISQNEMTCNSVVSVSEASGKTNSVRVLNNLYYFVKRCLRFRTMDISPRMLAVGRKNAVVQAYKITVSGDISAFVLSRPLYISFGTYGLYRVLHNMRDSVFSNYSNDKETYSFTVAPVFEYQKASMYPAVTQDITQLEQNSKIPITIYYLTYSGPILFSEVNAGKQKDSEVCNALTLVLSSTFLNTNVPITSKGITYTIPTSTDVAVSGILTATNLAISYEKTSIVANDILSITVAYGSTFTTIPVKIDPEFLNEIASCRQSKVDHSFHVVITYTTDVVIVSCFIKYSDSLKQDRVFMTRTAVNLGNEYVSIVYNNKNMISVLRELNGDLGKEMAKYSEFTSTNSIPNYAYVAKYLGYTI